MSRKLGNLESRILAENIPNIGTTLQEDTSIVLSSVHNLSISCESCYDTTYGLVKN